MKKVNINRINNKYITELDLSKIILFHFSKRSHFKKYEVSDQFYTILCLVVTFEDFEVFFLQIHLKQQIRIFDFL